jgi:hypothetical protein
MLGRKVFHPIHQDYQDKKIAGIFWVIMTDIKDEWH